MKQIIQKIILAGVIVYQGKILIIQRGSGEEAYPNLWELPSGKRDFLEPSEEALKREVKEETGLDIKSVAPVSVFEFKVEKPDEIRDATQISFLCKPIGEPKVKLSHEHQNFAWITKNELNDYRISKETKDVISKTFQLLRE